LRVGLLQRQVGTLEQRHRLLQHRLEGIASTFSNRPAKLTPARRMANAWQVSTVMPLASSPIRAARRRRISTAAWRL
jgi:hypothetical protein